MRVMRWSVGLLSAVTNDSDVDATVADKVRQPAETALAPIMALIMVSVPQLIVPVAHRNFLSIGNVTTSVPDLPPVLFRGRSTNKEFRCGR